MTTGRRTYTLKNTMAQVHYTKEESLSWKRLKQGDMFRYVTDEGVAIPKDQRDRVISLVIPPAWTNVMISSDPYGHIQAIGIDARGRKQYIYHADWIKKSQQKKFDQMVDFGERLPTLRKAMLSHMREHSLTRDRVTATVIWLLEHTFIRVGNKTYADENQSYGLTTMREKHVDVEGNTITFSFKGKSGVYHELEITHPRVAKTVRSCLELPGYELFQYVDEGKNRQTVDSADVNTYLQAYAGADFSAKDFRTWGGSVLAGDDLYQKGVPETLKEKKANISQAVTDVAKQLGNTKKVCKTYYIHPAIITSYEQDILVPHFEKSYKQTSVKKFGLTVEERAMLSLIKNF